jgi:hypothetical protein
MKLKKTFGTGETFVVPLKSNKFAIFQFAMQDTMQLSQDVIIVYRARFASIDDAKTFCPTLADLEFYTHTSVWLGLKTKLWHPLGKHDLPNGLNFEFRLTDEFGPHIEISKKWYLWVPNQPSRDVGELDSKSRAAEIGSIFGPPAVVERIQKGQMTHRFPN